MEINEAQERSADIPPKSPQLSNRRLAGHLYVLEVDGYLKLGYTVNIKKRMASYRSQAARILTPWGLGSIAARKDRFNLWGIKPAAGRGDETELLRRFWDERVINDGLTEWFKTDSEFARYAKNRLGLTALPAPLGRYTPTVDSLLSTLHELLLAYEAHGIWAPEFTEAKSASVVMLAHGGAHERSCHSKKIAAPKEKSTTKGGFRSGAGRKPVARHCQVCGQVQLSARAAAIHCAGAKMAKIDLSNNSLDTPKES